MYEHERSLVKRLAGKPFAILGINSDPKERLRKAMEDNELTWRSFWDGGSTGGPIASKWNVHGWPTLYIIDADGVIRHKGVRGNAINEAVDTLLAEIGAGDDSSDNDSSDNGDAGTKEGDAKDSGS